MDKITLEYTSAEERDLNDAVSRLEDAVIAFWAMQGEDVSESLGGDTYVDRINAAADEIKAANA